ncbi:YceI family protein [Rhodovulum sp. DZ06]|uniref:YceI family protein n=1 Tax=Rhodovulum sp. DZ06 TaxID=3425126 RepID=UPI003D32FB76
MRLAPIAAAAALSLVAAMPAAAEPWTLDKSHAAVTFQVNHLGFSSVQGVFRSFDAAVDFDPADIASSSVEFTIDAASIDTFWEARDNHIKTGDFLDVENHPTITFKSTSVEKLSDTTAKVTGELTMVGVTREETFDVTLNKLGPSPFNADLTVAGFTVEGVIDRTAYGMGYGAPAIGAELPLRVDLELNKQ